MHGISGRWARAPSGRLAGRGASGRGGSSLLLGRLRARSRCRAGLLTRCCLRPGGRRLGRRLGTLLLGRRPFLGRSLLRRGPLGRRLLCRSFLRRDFARYGFLRYRFALVGFRFDLLRGNRLARLGAGGRFGRSLAVAGRRCTGGRPGCSSSSLLRRCRPAGRPGRPQPVIQSSIQRVELGGQLLDFSARREADPSQRLDKCPASPVVRIGSLATELDRAFHGLRALRVALSPTAQAVE